VIGSFSTKIVGCQTSKLGINERDELSFRLPVARSEIKEESGYLAGM